MSMLVCLKYINTYEVLKECGNRQVTPKIKVGKSKYTYISEKHKI